MKKGDRARAETAYLEELIEEITVDANGEDEQLWAFRTASGYAFRARAGSMRLCVLVRVRFGISRDD